MISAEQAQSLSASTVAVAGMGVGAGIATQLALSGVGGLRIADSDTIAVSNLNRHPIATAADIGRPKVDVVHSWIAALDDTISVQTFTAVTDTAAAEQFLSGARLLVEEVDDYAAKWTLRTAARSAEIPVVTATDLWERVLIDVEDYGVEPDRDLFHGLVTSDTDRLEALTVLFQDHCDSRFWTAATTGASFPQLGATLAIASGLVSMVVRDLLTGAGLRSGRYLFNYDLLETV